MSYWKDEPWAKPHALMALLEDIYAKAIAAGKIKDPLETATRKVIQHRNWCASVRPEVVRAEIERLEMVYVPKGVGPGPGLCFPIRDVTGEIQRLHIRLLEDGPKKFGMKYMSLVDKEEFVGPAWIGLDEDTMEAVLRKQELILVEGPLDLLAVRIMRCPVPSLSPTSKRLTKDHWTHLRILGVERLLVMFDNETSGVGEKASDWLTRNPFQIDVTPLRCPSKDPSKALEHADTVDRLQEALPFPPPANAFADI